MLDVRRMRDLLRLELDSFLLLCIISNNKNNINKRRNNNKKLDFLAFVDSTDDGSSCRHRLQNFAVFCTSYPSKAIARGYISYMKFIIFTDWVSGSRIQSQLFHLFLNSVLLPLRIYLLLLLLHSELPPGVERSPLVALQMYFCRHFSHEFISHTQTQPDTDFSAAAAAVLLHSCN